MAINLNESFTVDASIDALWAFILNPDNIARCMPGASIDEIIDEHSFSGKVKVSIGAISVRYRGTITYTETDRDSGRITLRAQAVDKSGGTVEGTITTQLSALSTTQTEVNCSSEIDLTGRLVAVGRGMIEGVASEIIGQFVNNVRQEIETDEPQEIEREITPPGPAPAPNILLIVLKVMYTRISNTLQRLLGRQPTNETAK